MRHVLLLASLVFGLAVLGSAFTASARADTIGPFTFEPTTYTTGDINGQDGWTKTGVYDVEVAIVSAFGAASGYTSMTISPAVVCMLIVVLRARLYRW